MRILLVDDDKRLCDTLKRGLEENAYSVDCVHDGDEGYYYTETTPYDLIILDVMMPLRDGIEVCGALRAKKVPTPILMLTAKDTVEESKLAAEKLRNETENVGREMAGIFFVDQFDDIVTGERPLSFSVECKPFGTGQRVFAPKPIALIIRIGSQNKRQP